MRAFWAPQDLDVRKACHRRASQRGLGWEERNGVLGQGGMQITRERAWPWVLTACMQAYKETQLLGFWVVTFRPF